MFASLEKPAAYAAFVFALASLIWKSPLGMDWIPLLGRSWSDVFRSLQQDKIPQYPRRPNDEEFWHVVYLLMYGVLGTVAQYGGILITNRSIPSRQSLVFWCRIYGLFHFIIGCHHLVWSIYHRNYGKLELWRYNLPAAHELTGLAALGLIYHALYIMRTATANNLRDICHRKAVMDTVTCSTFTGFLAFLVANTVGMETSFETKRIWWAITMYPSLVILLLGFVME